MTCSKSAKCKFSIHGCLILCVKKVVSVVTWPAKKNGSQKGYIEMKGFFHLGTHLKCAGMVTFILLLFIFPEKKCVRTLVVI